MSGERGDRSGARDATGRSRGEAAESGPGSPGPREARSGTGSGRRRRAAGRSGRPRRGRRGALGRAAACRFRPPPRAPGGGGSEPGDARQRGFVTAELAVALPVVVAVLGLSMWAVATIGLKIRVTDAAHSAALAAARGEDPQTVAASYLPEGATVSVSDDGAVVRTTVTASSRPLGMLAPEMEVSAEGSAPKEPGPPE